MLLLLAAATLVLGLLLAAELIRGVLALPRLADAPPLGADPPRVSIIVAARDEARHVCTAAMSLLEQDYPDFEVVVVNDRSTDGTGALLDQLARERPALRVVHVSELPAGWLGKNHALQRGAEVADGEILLFTDADVVMQPPTLRRAVSLLRAGERDHLAVAPRIHVGGPWATMTVSVFLTAFLATFRPWKARDPDNSHHIGIGAFNLVQADAYRAIGGHRSVALRPDDDVRLGRALKRAGYRQAAASGVDELSVEWYSSLRELARGFRKNAFAAMDYRLWPVAGGTVAAVLMTLWPAVALLVTAGAVWWLNLAIMAVGAATMVVMAIAHRLPVWTALTYPLGVVLLLWVLWSASLRVLITGSVEWRGTHYSLEELRGR